MASIKLVARLTKESTIKEGFGTKLAKVSLSEGEERPSYEHIGDYKKQTSIMRRRVATSDDKRLHPMNMRKIIIFHFRCSLNSHPKFE